MTECRIGLHVFRLVRLHILRLVSLHIFSLVSHRMPPVYWRGFGSRQSGLFNWTQRIFDEAELVNRIVTALHKKWRINDLLETQQHQNLATAFGEGFECFADECAGTVNLYTADVNGLRLHGYAGKVAGDE